MILSHFTHEAFVLDLNRKYSDREIYIYKPNGLWLSDESEEGWKEWCTSNDFYLQRLTHKTDFKVNMDNICHLKDYEDICSFEKKYLLQHDLRHLRNIDWLRVKKEFSGIVITPHIWQSRFESVWYHGWDCASGCIWDLKVLELI